MALNSCFVFSCVGVIWGYLCWWLWRKIWSLQWRTTVSDISRHCNCSCSGCAIQLLS